MDSNNGIILHAHENLAFSYENEDIDLQGKYIKRLEEDVEQEIQEKSGKQDQIKKIGEFRTALPQFLACSAKNLVLLDLGMAFGYSTIVIPALLKGTDEIKFTPEQASWFGSVVFICQPIGSIVSGFLSEPWGRKNALIFVNFPHILGWFMMYYATTLTQLFAAAIVLGVGIGFMEAPLLTYIGEISQPKWRGALVQYSQIYYSFGLFLIFLIGTLTDWRMAAAISSSIPILAILAMTQVPESPVWLLAKGRNKAAEKSLCWLRGWVEPEQIKEEFQELVKQTYVRFKSKVKEVEATVIVDDEDLPETRAGKRSVGSKKNLIQLLGLNDLFRKQSLQPLLLVTIFFVFHHLAGITGTRPYMVQIFTQFGSPLDSYWTTVIEAIIGVMANVTGFFVIHKIGKRTIGHISFIGGASCNILISIYGVTFVESNAPWIPITLYYILNFLWSFGIGLVPWLLISEIFPLQGRELLAGIAAAIAYLIGFFVTKTYYDIVNGLTLPGSFAFYGVTMIIGWVFFYFYIPETEGKSLVEAQELFSKIFSAYHNRINKRSAGNA